jgi:hypothetical protein
MVGMKFKLAHKRPAKNKWSVSEDTQRKNLIKILEDFVKGLQKEPEKTVPVPLNFDYRGNNYTGVAIPAMSSCNNGICDRLDVTLNKKHLGIIRCTKQGWRITDVPQGLVNTIGKEILAWYSE